MKQYFLLFQNSKKRYWWNYFTRPCFEHVDLLMFDNNNKILTVITGDMNGIDLNYGNIKGSIYNHLKNIKTSDNIIIIEIPKENNIAQKFIIASCVGISKRFLAVRNRFIFTPYQLYNYFNKKRKILWQHQQ